MSNTLIGQDRIKDIREVLTANRTYYVRTDGSDSNDGLTDSAGGAFLTIQKAFDTITELDKNGYDVYVYVGSGTFSEDVVVSLGVGEGTVYLYGTLSLQETATSATVAAGSGATQGTVTKTGQWTGDVYANFLAYFVTDDAYRIIDSHTNDVLTLCGTAPSSTAQNVSVYGWGTTIRSIDVSERGSFHCYNCKFDNTTYSITTGVFSSPTFEQCYIDYGITTYSQSMTLEKCSIRSELARGIWVKQGKLISHYSKVLLGANGSAFYVIDGANVEVQQGTVVDGAGYTGTYGVYVFGNASANMFGSSSAGYPRVRNWTYGIFAETGGQFYNTSNIIYSGNTTNDIVGREVLTAARTYYVRTDGSDDNSGLANTSAGAFLTIQKAINVATTLDFAGYAVTIQIGDGTYTASLTLSSPWVGGGSLTLKGNTSTPANVLISTTSSNCISVTATLPGAFTMQDMELRTTTSGYCISHSGAGTVYISNVRFGASAGYHMFTDSTAAIIRASGNYAVTGNAVFHYTAVIGEIYIPTGISITVSAGLTFTYFTYATRRGVVWCQGTFSTNVATGTRYVADANGVIYTNGAGATYFPGSVAGATSTGGQYI